MNRRGVLLVVAIAGIPSAAWPQGNPVGPEFRVNTYTPSSQQNPSVAANASGFVVVWESDQDGSGQGVFGQRYDGSGAPAGPEFQVNSYTTNAQNNPAVATTASGAFVVVWCSNGQDGSGNGVFGQRYDSSGAPLGPEFRVNTSTTSTQYRPSVAADGAGNFVWHGSIYPRITRSVASVSQAAALPSDRSSPSTSPSVGIGGHR